MKLNGYRASHRNKWYFIQKGILSVQELSLLEYYADIFCFNNSQPNYGTFKVNFEEIANIFHYKSDATVRGWHAKLLEIGFIDTTDDRHVFKLTCCGRYIGQSEKIKGEAIRYQELEKNQPIETILQSFGIEFHSIGEKVQSIGIEDDKKIDSTIQTKSLTKYSYNSSTLSSIPSSITSQKVVITRQSVRSDAEYQKFYEENHNYPTPDDMKWIDQNVLY